MLDMKMTFRCLTTVVVEKERKQLEKNKKFAAKKAKAAEPASATTSKNKEKKAKADAVTEPELPDYVEETPAGQKKSMLYSPVDARTSSNAGCQFSNLLMMTITKPIYPKSSNPAGMHGGKRKATLNRNLVQMAKSARRATLSSQSHHLMSLASYTWAMHYRMRSKIL